MIQKAQLDIIFLYSLQIYVYFLNCYLSICHYHCYCRWWASHRGLTSYLFDILKSRIQCLLSLNVGYEILTQWVKHALPWDAKFSHPVLIMLPVDIFSHREALICSSFGYWIVTSKLIDILSVICYLTILNPHTEYWLLPCSAEIFHHVSINSSHGVIEWFGLPCHIKPLQREIIHIYWLISP